MIVLAHADAVILHHKAVPGVVLVPGQLFHLEPDMPAGGRILDRIGEDVHQHLIQTVGVGQHVFVLHIGAYRKGLTALTCLLPDDAVQHIDAVVIFVGVAAEIIVQLGHALGDAKVAQGDLFFSALQCDGVESCFRNTIRESSTVSELET